MTVDMQNESYKLSDGERAIIGENDRYTITNDNPYGGGL